ncbi:MAG TPA: tetratricopeptide repeat protein, partial [Bryobacteraceae bacterium]|nr:tetratricopeptide repeat protein [Bryobacteraceae bacterium]
ALGAGMRLAQGPAKGRPEPRVDLDPLLARLKDVESRIVEIESTEPVAHAPAPPVFVEKTLAAFESKLAAQLSDVEELRGEIRHVDERLGALDVQLPVLIQSTVDVRFREVEQRLQHDFEEAQSRSMSAFVETLQTKVVERISTLETNLAEQSQVIGTLRDASVRSDENLQKMLAGIERLVDQSKAPPPAPAASPPPPPEPVATHREAAEEPEPPIAGFSVRERSRANYEVRRFPARQVAASLPTVEEPKLEEPASVPSIPVPMAPAAIRPFTAMSDKPEPVLISDAAQTDEMAPTVGVLGCIPEIPRSRDVETPHANGAVPEPVAMPVPAAELHAADTVRGSQPPGTDELVKSDESYEWVNRIGLELLAPRPRPTRSWRVPLAIGVAAALLIFLVAGLFYSGLFQRYFNSNTTRQQPSTLASTAPVTDAAVPPPGADNKPPVDNNLQTLEQRAASKPADPSSLVELAREYQRRKDWTKAESAYRSALETSPSNRDAALGLSDVLYQQQKYEESAAVLNKISSEKPR